MFNAIFSGTFTGTFQGTITPTPPAGAYLWDKFTGADGDAVLGRTPDTNGNGANVWQFFEGTVSATILNNRATLLTEGNPRHYYDVGHSDYTLTYILNLQSGFADISFRASDAEHYYLARIFSDGFVRLYEHDGGFAELGGQFQPTGVGVDIPVTIICNGSAISLQVGDSAPLTATDTFNQAATLVGFNINLNDTIDDYKVAAL